MSRVWQYVKNGKCFSHIHEVFFTRKHIGVMYKAFLFGYFDVRSKDVLELEIGNILSSFSRDARYGSLELMFSVSNNVAIFPCFLFRGPMVPGLAPSEASERLQTVQAKFDELWRKYITYSSKYKNANFHYNHSFIFTTWNVLINVLEWN